MEFGFFHWLVVVSLLAALAAQLRGLNGIRPNWRQIAASTFFYTAVGIAAGLLAYNRYSKDMTAILGAVMAALLLRVDPEKILGKLVKNHEKNTD